MKALFTSLILLVCLVGTNPCAHAQILAKVKPTVTLEGKEMIDAACKLVKDHYAGKVTPVIKSVPRNWNVPVGKREYKLVMQGQRQEFLPNGIDLLINGKRYSTLSLGQYLVYKLTAPVSQVEINPNQVLTEQNVADIEVQMVAGYKIPPDIDSVIGKAAAIRILTQKIIRETMLMEPYTVVRGDSVSVRIIRGLVTLEVPGQALQNGRVGDRITVKLNTNSRVITGTIENKGLVVLEVQP